MRVARLNRFTQLMPDHGARARHAVLPPRVIRCAGLVQQSPADVLEEVTALTQPSISKHQLHREGSKPTQLLAS
jgi:hypothetical protein